MLSLRVSPLRICWRINLFINHLITISHLLIDWAQEVPAHNVPRVFATLPSLGTAVQVSYFTFEVISGYEPGCVS